MELTFETYGQIGSGSFPDFIQFYNTEGQLFFTDAGLIHGTDSARFDGDFTTPQWNDTLEISPEGDTGITNLELKNLNGFGIVGSYYTADEQVMIIYEFQYDMSKYLSGGSIKHSIDNPISSFTLTLENPIDEETEIEGPVVMNEKSTLLSPGAKIIFRFGMGDDFEEYEMGTFYVDRSNYSVRSNTASVDGRNLIGKALKDQTLNENNVISYDIITNIINGILEKANLGIDQYEVEYDATYRRFRFDPSKTVYSALEEIFRTMVDWKMEETVQEEIIVGSPSYGLFPTRGMYNFQRDKDIFSRSITMDDQGSYRKVCVHDSEWNIQIYEDVASFSGWNLQSNKTLFVQVAEGTSSTNAQAIATELASRLESVGKVETFTGPFRPQLLVGDGATIMDSEGNTELGLITEITHNFGKSGFTTNFTVDSGGRLGRGRLSDYIRMIDNKQEVGSVFYEDIPVE
jgi:hypothetical protein